MLPNEFRATADALSDTWRGILEGGAYRDYHVLTAEQECSGQLWQISLEYYSEARDTSVRKPLLRFQEVDSPATRDDDISMFFRRNEDLLQELHALADTGILDEVEDVLRQGDSSLSQEDSMVLQVDSLYAGGGHRDPELLEEFVAIIHLHHGALLCETMISQRKSVTTVDEAGRRITYRVPFEKERYLDRVIKPATSTAGGGHPYVFVLMSFEKAPYLRDAYGAIKRAVADWNEDALVERVDEIQEDFRITDKIQECVQRADFVVADLTGERPNVYYEIGFARGLEKRMVHTARKGTPIHFDLKDFNTIFWDSAETLQRALTQRLKGMTRRAPA